MINIIDAFELGLYPKIKVICEPQLGKRGLYPRHLSYIKESIQQELEWTSFHTAIQKIIFFKYVKKLILI